MTPLQQKDHREESQHSSTEISVISPGTPPRTSTATTMIRQQKTKDADIIDLLSSSDDDDDDDVKNNKNDYYNDDDDDDDKEFESPIIVSNRNSRGIRDSIVSSTRKSLEKELDEPHPPNNIVVTATSTNRTVFSPTRPALCRNSSADATTAEHHLETQLPGTSTSLAPTPRPTSFGRTAMSSSRSILSPNRKFVKMNNKSRTDYNSRITNSNTNVVIPPTMSTTITVPMTGPNIHPLQNTATGTAGNTSNVVKQTARKTLFIPRKDGSTTATMGMNDTTIKNTHPAFNQPNRSSVAVSTSSDMTKSTISMQEPSIVQHNNSVSVKKNMASKSTIAATVSNNMLKEAPRKQDLSVNSVVINAPPASSNVTEPAPKEKYSESHHESNLCFPPPTVLYDKSKYIPQKSGNLEISHTSQPPLLPEQSKIATQTNTHAQLYSLFQNSDRSYMGVAPTNTTEMKKKNLPNAKSTKLQQSKGPSTVSASVPRTTTVSSSAKVLKNVAPDGTLLKPSRTYKKKSPQSNIDGSSQCPKKTVDNNRIFTNIKTSKALSPLPSDNGPLLQSNPQGIATLTANYTKHMVAASPQQTDVVKNGNSTIATTDTREKPRRLKSMKTILTTTEREHPDHASDGPSSSTNDADDVKVWRETILPLLQYCGKCEHCEVKPCQQCRLCTLVPVASVNSRKNVTNGAQVPSNKRMKTSRRYCIFNCCSTCDAKLTRNGKKQNRTTVTSSTTTNSRVNHLCDRQKVYQWYRNEISAVIQKVESERRESQSPDSYLFDIGMVVYCYWPDSKVRD